MGYMYYKLDQFDDAISWYQKTIRVDRAQRGVCQATHPRCPADLREKYLELAPTAGYAPNVRIRLSTGRP